MAHLCSHRMFGIQFLAAMSLDLSWCSSQTSTWYLILKYNFKLYTSPSLQYLPREPTIPTNTEKNIDFPCLDFNPTSLEIISIPFQWWSLIIKDNNVGNFIYLHWRLPLPTIRWKLVELLVPICWALPSVLDTYHRHLYLSIVSGLHKQI